MSVDLYLTIDVVSFLVAGAILAFGAYRALQFRKAFNDPIFRSRALWTALVLAAWIVPNDTQILFNDLPPPSSSIGFLADLVTVILAVLLILVSVVFIDRNIRAARELDFFHRDSLGWEKLKLVAMVGAPGSILLNLLGFFVLGNTILANLLANLTSFLLPATLAYGVAALLLSGIRVHNRYMRRYLEFAGIGFILLIVTIPLAVPILYDVFLLLGSYFLYLSATSLYQLRDVQKGI